jgi:hypothetical protein
MKEIEEMRTSYEIIYTEQDSTKGNDLTGKVCMVLHRSHRKGRQRRKGFVQEMTSQNEGLT